MRSQRQRIQQQRILRKVLILFNAVLALLAGLIGIGLWLEDFMWPWIVLYWMVLTAKNILEIYKR